ncbi:MAG: helix-turn-helix transcriptional regulator [Bacteroidales bacterium]|nr:helix-turn-helix transcriptional regulator [Bacteroidales bacterium]
MIENKRIKRAINWLISQGYFSSQKEIGIKIGITNRSYLSQLVNSDTPNIEFINKFTSIAPQISASWLLTGEGNMIYEKSGTPEFNAQPIKDEELSVVPLINIDSVGGVHSSNALTASEQYVERMIPFLDARPGDVAILQSGNSMAPTIPAGAILQIRRVEGWREYFGYGNVFVLWLSDDRRITKQVLKYRPDPQTYVTCHSYNPESADEELPKSMIKEVWKVVNVLINKGW